MSDTRWAFNWPKFVAPLSFCPAVHRRQIHLWSSSLRSTAPHRHSRPIQCQWSMLTVWTACWKSIRMLCHHSRREWITSWRAHSERQQTQQMRRYWHRFPKPVKWQHSHRSMQHRVWTCLVCKCKRFDCGPNGRDVSRNLRFFQLYVGGVRFTLLRFRIEQFGET